MTALATFMQPKLTRVELEPELHDEVLAVLG